MISIRPEEPDDAVAVRTVNEMAFGQPQEADIVDAIRRACPDTVSLVADSDGYLVGHILFSPVTLAGVDRTVTGVGLAPMAVRPEHQRHGIGSRLVEAGLDILRQRKCPFVIVLGHPAFYPRFGFVPAGRHGLRCQWEGVPDEAFMVLVLDKAALLGVSGVVRYRDEFDAAV